MKYTIELLTSLVIGVIFSVGLSISGMVNPNIVLGFLDILGDWNPTLMFVMGGALAIGIPLFYIIKKREKTIIGLTVSRPSKTKLDKSLIIGAILFGTGWGFTGVCPGPGVANLFLMNTTMLVFIASMLLGMIIGKKIVNK